MQSIKPPARMLREGQIKVYLALLEQPFESINAYQMKFVYGVPSATAVRVLKELNEKKFLIMETRNKGERKSKEYSLTFYCLRYLAISLENHYAIAMAKKCIQFGKSFPELIDNYGELEVLSDLDASREKIISSFSKKIADWEDEKNQYNSKAFQYYNLAKIKKMCSFNTELGRTAIKIVQEIEGLSQDVISNFKKSEVTFNKYDQIANYIIKDISLSSKSPLLHQESKPAILSHN